MDRREQRFKKRTAVTKEQALNFLCVNEAAEQNREAHHLNQQLVPNLQCVPGFDGSKDRIFQILKSQITDDLIAYFHKGGLDVFNDILDAPDIDISQQLPCCFLLAC